MKTNSKLPFGAARYLGAAAIALGAIVLIGWAGGVPPLVRPAAQWAAMQPLTACGFVLAGFALQRMAARQLRVARWLALPLAALPAASLLQQWSGIQFGIDTVLFPNAVSAQAAASQPGRMAAMTAIAFLLFCLFLAWPRGTPRQYRSASHFATLGLILAFMGGTGYILGARDLARVGGYTAMAVYSALGLALLFSGALLSQRDANWLHLLLERSTGGAVTRRLLAHIVGWPLALALVLRPVPLLAGNRRLEIALYAFCLALALFIAVVRVARQLKRSEASRERAVGSMLRSRSQLAGVLETAMDAVVTVDEACRIVFFNRAAERIFGCPAQQALGMPIERFIPERYRAGPQAYLQRFAAEAGRQGELEDLRALRLDGSEFPIDASVAQTGAGGQRRTTLILRDITQRKAVEDRLRASEEQYRTLFSNMAEGFALAEPAFDARGEPAGLRLLETNKAFRQMGGIANDAQAPAWLDRAALDACLRVVRSERAERIEIERADGHRHFELYAYSPAAGRLAMLVRDITGQKRLARTQMQRERDLREVIGTLPAMVWIASPAGEFQYLSGQWLSFTGTTLESQLGERSWDQLHPDDRERVSQLWRCALQRHDPFDSEYRLRRHDGQYRWVKSRGVPLFDAGGGIARWVGAITDIDDLRRANDALADSERRLAVALQTSRSAVWELDVASGRLVGDDLMYTALGYAPGEIETDAEWLALVHPDERDSARHSLAAVLRGERDNFRLELRVLAKDGTWRWNLSQAAVAERDAQGRALRLIGTHTDIGERKQTEQALKDSEERYRTLFANMTEAFGLGEPILDAAGRVRDLRFLEVNDAFFRETGMPRDFLGRPMGDVYRLPEPDWTGRFASVALTGQPTHFNAFHAGTARHFDVYAFCPRRGQFAILFRDVTAARRTESALQESEASLRQLIATLPGMVWTSDQAGAVDFVSQQWLDYTGTALESQLGSGFLAVIHPDDRERVAALWQQALATGTPFHAEYRLRRHDGAYHWFKSRGTPVPQDRAGHPRRWLGVTVDIDDLKRAQQELQDSEQRYRALFNNKTSAIAHHRVITDQHGRPVDYEIVAVNDTYETILGLKREQVQGRRASEIYPGVKEFEHNPIAQFGRVGLEGGETTLEAFFPPTAQWLRVYAYCPKPGEFTAIFTDITEQRLAEQRVRDAALHDTLTKLPNRALVFEYGGHLLAQAARRQSQVALLFIDLDRFKPINDMYGHGAGDRVLREAAARLTACTRQEDLVGRLGGDEFVILLPHLDQARHRAATVAQHVVESLSLPFKVGSLELTLSASVGICQYPQDGADVGTLIHAADLAMYQAKQSGRANYQFYTAELERHADEAYSLEARLRRALRQGGFALHYQPVVEIGSGRLIGAEALVRLADGEGPGVGPARFIPVAEGAGLIGDIGEWVVNEACRQQLVWHSEGLHIPVAINVSPLQFRQRDFADRLARVLERTGVDPSCLQLEVTESAVMESLDEAVAILNRIKSLGVKIALDDFGTGYSSLSRLSSLPLDMLKVDQSFVRGLESDPASRAVTEAIIALGRTLNLEVIGEGIESERALQYLRAHGCNRAQGFLFSEPLSAARFAHWREERALQ